MLSAGVGDVFGFGITVDELLQGQQGLQGALLVARHVGDLVVVRHRHDVLRVRRVRGGRVQLQIALRGVDGVLVVLALEMGIGGHEQGFARPIRIRILLLELAELLGGALVVALLHATETLVVELPGGHLRNDLHLVALGLVERVERRQRIASAEQKGAGQQRDRANRNCRARKSDLSDLRIQNRIAATAEIRPRLVGQHACRSFAPDGRSIAARFAGSLS